MKFFLKNYKFLPKKYYLKALEKSLSSDYKSELATIYAFIGELFLKKGNRDSTYYYFNKSFLFKRKLHQLEHFK